MACSQCESLSAAVLDAFEGLKTIVDTFSEQQVAERQQLQALEVARQRYRYAFDQFERHLSEHGQK
jgi:hypothetical protein